MNRREFLAAGLASPALAAQSAPRDPDLREVISRADLVYAKPVPRSEEGIPIGNGRMGTLVWAMPFELRFQINRVDVFGNNSYTNSFFQRNEDYCGGCGFVEIDFGAGAPPFPSEGFSQRLSVYDGLLEIEGENVRARLVAWPDADVIAIEIEDRRAEPDAIEIHLRMLRYASQTRSQTAASQLHIRGERIALTQEFREGEFCSRSAVAIGVVGRQATARIPNEIEVRLTAAPGPGAFTVLIASAASFDALPPLEAAADKGFAALARETAAWWHNFWARGHVRLSSRDGVAQKVELNYHYFLYLMAATSRGKFPPKFNGMLWNTAGDLRTWGAQYWFANLSCYYEALPAANRLELMDPAFDMYSGMYDACATAARQQWGSRGIYIPETVWFDGLANLPDDIAAEMRELYLLRKPWDQRSARFREFAATKHPHSSRWNWQQRGRDAVPFGPVTHILGSTAKIAYLYWRRYEYTLDQDWLRRRAYPMLKGAAEFYRNFPNVRKGDDGKYHIHHVNSNESVWGASDTDEDLSAMRGVFAALLRAAAILNVDADMLPVWREFLENLAPLPTSDDPDALKPEGYTGPRVFVRARKPAVQARGFLPDGNSLPMWFFDLCQVESRDRRMLETANNTFAASFREPVGLLSKIAIAAASLGRADAVRTLIPSQIEGLGVLANHMSLREGPQALDAERLGRASEALQMALLQSNPPAPGEDPILHVFPAWPPEWSAAYKLRARGAFVVRAAMEGGRVRFVELVSEAGAECRLRNPWGESRVTLERDGRKAESLAGSLLRFGTRRGETIVLRG